VKTEQFDTQQSTNVLDYLNGTVAGFNANIGTSASGSSSMEIRGPTSLSANSSPLIVLDGVIFTVQLMILILEILKLSIFLRMQVLLQLWSSVQLLGLL